MDVEDVTLFLSLKQLLDLEQHQGVYRRNLEKCIRERDTLLVSLEEERQLRENDDEEMRKKVKVGEYCGIHYSLK